MIVTQAQAIEDLDLPLSNFSLAVFANDRLKRLYHFLPSHLLDFTIVQQEQGATRNVKFATCLADVVNLQHTTYILGFSEQEQHTYVYERGGVAASRWESRGEEIQNSPKVDSLPDNPSFSFLRKTELLYMPTWESIPRETLLITGDRVGYIDPSGTSFLGQGCRATSLNHFKQEAVEPYLIGKHAIPFPFEEFYQFGNFKSNESSRTNSSVKSRYFDLKPDVAPYWPSLLWSVRFNQHILPGGPSNLTNVQQRQGAPKSVVSMDFD